MNKNKKIVHLINKKFVGCIFMENSKDKGEQLHESEKHIMEARQEFDTEVGEDATKYGEFVCSYFAWISLPEQKEKAEELQKITKKREK